MPLAPRNELMDEVQAALSDDLIKPAYRDSRRRHFDGHCYHAAEAYFHLAGGTTSGLSFRRRRNDDGTSHWWLVDEEDRVIDLSLGPNDKGTYEYEEGNGAAPLTGYVKASKSAAQVIRRVQDARASGSGSRRAGWSS